MGRRHIWRLRFMFIFIGKFMAFSAMEGRGGARHIMKVPRTGPMSSMARYHHKHKIHIHHLPPINRLIHNTSSNPPPLTTRNQPHLSQSHPNLAHPHPTPLTPHPTTAHPPSRIPHIRGRNGTTLSLPTDYTLLATPTTGIIIGSGIVCDNGPYRNLHLQSSIGW